MQKIIFYLFIFTTLYSCKKKITETYPDGKIKTSTEINGNNQRDGLYKSYYPDGQLMEEKYYTKDVLNGDVKEYFNNSKLKTIAKYENDEPIFSRSYDIHGNMTDGIINSSKYNFDTVPNSIITIDKLNGAIIPDQVYEAHIKNSYIPSKYLRLFIIPGTLIYSDSTYSNFSFKVTNPKTDSVTFQVLAQLNKKQGLLIHQLKFNIKK